jgi:phosphohistidine phosphatase
VATHLWLLRHGEAVPHGSKPDFERELTEKGERQARIAGLALARAGVAFDACYTSPKVRARDTARLAVAELGVQAIEDQAIADDFDRHDLTFLDAHDGHVLVVGHEPDFSQLVHDLTGARVDFKKGGLAAVELASAPQLIALLRPAELSLIAQPG